MSGAISDWGPTASRSALQLRAAMLASARRFFADRGVLEVETPMLVNAPVTDVHIHSAEVHMADQAAAGRRFFLHTSPEYAMKRLLAAGSGDIFQICHVVRDFERSRLHNAEFTLIEWYRIGFSAEQLMDEVDALVRQLLEPQSAQLSSERFTYREVFLQALQLDPLLASLEELKRAAAALGMQSALGGETTRDDVLDLLMGAHIGPKLGHRALTFVHRYPASQAALARLDPQDARTALRFELYHEGVELANGFQELASSAEQRARFEQDRRERQRRGLPVFAPDERLLAALDAGLPECSGVALGFDRVAMLASGAARIEDVMAFPLERA